jgi:chemotaxis protein MotA
MKRSFFLNYLIGFVFIGLAVFVSAKDATLFFNITGIIIVAGGSVAALFASYPAKEIASALRKARSLLQNSPLNEEQEVEEIVQFARLWSRNDIRAIEKRLEHTPNRFLHTGVQMLIAKAPLPDVTSTLTWRIKRLKVREQAEARVFHSLASYAPAFGMVGTLIGLVNMMLVMDNQNLEAMGFNWAVALVTTFYGLLLANLIFKPIATKLERRTEKRLLLMSMVLEGIKLMGMRRGPAFIRENLNSFITLYDNELAEPSSNEVSEMAHPLSATSGSVSR